MRHRRIVTLLSVLGVVAALAVTGCGVAADDTAATVGDTVISASLVNQLASSDKFMQAMTSQALTEQRVGVIDGGDARQVLAFLIQREVLAQEVERWGVEVTDQDRAAAAQAIEQNAPQLSASQRELVATFLADRDALGTRLAKLSASSEADLRRMYDSLGPYWDQVCLTAVAVPTDSVRAAERALDRGTKLRDLPGRVKSTQVVATDRQCLAAANLPGALRSSIHDAPAAVLVGPVSGIYPGDQAVLWYVLGSRRHVSFEAARDQLRELAGNVVQQGVAAWLTLKVNQGVTIDPRYGSEVQVDSSGLTVTAPALPLGDVAASPTQGPGGGTGSGPGGG